jgi:hypothetical protein
MEWETIMRMMLFLVSIALTSFAGDAHAQTAREKCCKQMSGRWEANRRTGEMRCFGVASNPYYQCVAAGGLRKK